VLQPLASQPEYHVGDGWGDTTDNSYFMRFLGGVPWGSFAGFPR
jgi:hypothetical protein